MNIKNFIQKTVLPQYDLGEFQSMSILSSGYANKNYKLVTDERSILCRVIVQKSKQQLEQELKLLDFLKGKKFPAAYPIQRADGAYINDEKHLIVFYDYLEGTEPSLNKKTSWAIGDAIGLLNALRIGNVVQRSNDITLEKCNSLISTFTNPRDFLIPIFSYFEEETEQLREPLSTNLPKGLVHGDVFADNTVFSGNKLLGIIDFEEACIDQLLFDLGVAINGFCYPDNRLNEALLKTLLQAYQNRRPFEPEEIELLPWFIRWGAHSQIFWHLRYGLLNHSNKKQLKRVEQLIKRVKWARHHMANITQVINQSLKVVN